MSVEGSTMHFHGISACNRTKYKCKEALSVHGSYYSLHYEVNILGIWFIVSTIIVCGLMNQ